jgi:UDP-3-O-[3-hydroxymyristoyl] glucosamine N-acyltransferase
VTLAELIQALGGHMVQGNPGFAVRGVNSAALACAADLVFAEESASVAEALASLAGAVVLRGAHPLPLAKFPHKHVIEAAQPRLWFARAARLLKPAPNATGIHPTAVLGADVQLGDDVFIGPGASIGDAAAIGAHTRIEAGAVVGEGVRTGAGCHIYPRSVLYPGTTLGDRVVVHAGAVLGADGFGYVRDGDSGAYTQFPQQGTLVIEDDVEIGANSTIDRGALKETRIRRGTKIDNLVHVGHNCDIGEDVIIVSGTGISGSCTVGKGAILAGQVGMGDHSHVGPGVIMGGQSGILPHKTITNKGLKPGTVMWGTPARPLMQELREQATLTRLTNAGRSKKAKNIVPGEE